MLFERMHPTHSSAGELEIASTVERFLAGFPAGSLELLRRRTAIPNRPDTLPDTLLLITDFGQREVSKVSAMVEGLRLALGVRYEELQPVLQKQLGITQS